MGWGGRGDEGGTRLSWKKSRLSTPATCLGLFGRLENLEGTHQGVVDAHHGARVGKLSAVVWRGEDGDQASICEELVAGLDDLMRAAHEVEVEAVEEADDNVGAKGEGDAAIVLAPAADLLVRVGPQQVAQQALVRDVCRAHYSADLLHGRVLGGEASVGAEDFLVDDGRTGHKERERDGGGRGKRKLKKKKSQNTHKAFRRRDGARSRQEKRQGVTYMGKLLKQSQNVFHNLTL